MRYSGRLIVGCQRGLRLYFVSCWFFSVRYNPRRWSLREHNYHTANPIVQQALDDAYDCSYAV